MNNLAVKKALYEIIKNLLPFSADTAKQVLQKEGSIPLKLTEYNLPKSLTLKFEELPDILNELQSLGLIKLDGMPDKVMGWARVKNPTSGIMEKVPAFNMLLLKLVSSDTAFKDAKKPVDSENKKYWIDYTADREVILNGERIIIKMQLNSISDCWFGYLAQNPMKNVTLKIVKGSSGTDSNANYGFNKFLNNINFKGQLRKLFFKQGERGIIFYNPITEGDLDKRKGIDVKKLEKEIAKLKKIKSPK